MTNLEPTLRALANLARHPCTEYEAAIGVIPDIGRALREPNGPITELETALGAARFTADHRARIESPLGVLRQGKADTYLAGALWACFDIVRAYNASIAAERERRAQRMGRDTARKTVIELLNTQADVSPKEVRTALTEKGVEVSAETVSKALADLLQDGIIVESQPRRGSNRRQRFYRLAEASADNRSVERIRAALDELRTQISRPEMEALLADWIQPDERSANRR
ncbi:MAG TPA: hypothetical protein VM938_12825 [Acidimicrobiales bacterium]|nr:hypothetical protein [Acidimicrobiales bacterium]